VGRTHACMCWVVHHTAVGRVQGPPPTHLQRRSQGVIGVTCTINAGVACAWENHTGKGCPTARRVPPAPSVLLPACACIAAPAQGPAAAKLPGWRWRSPWSVQLLEPPKAARAALTGGCCERRRAWAVEEPGTPGPWRAKQQGPSPLHAMKPVLFMTFTTGAKLVWSVPTDTCARAAHAAGEVAEARCPPTCPHTAQPGA